MINSSSSSKKHLKQSSLKRSTLWRKTLVPLLSFRTAKLKFWRTKLDKMVMIIVQIGTLWVKARSIKGQLMREDLVIALP